ncbi:MBOAT family O-acyltransferase [Polaribacter aquimarinus]|uniref:Membrane-bound O-acyltransferase family protein n=1 Tax=Polaribacter aquimarinus TaxID=2100726 RepID=A0A2U2J743_9FLAO|nr:MBOAT family O-acyltransferase [Polaribacter aquimarinus]PWG04159.1 membrane-bound O-acyltransferase family protein [Polaribacter aquimarinus]
MIFNSVDFAIFVTIVFFVYWFFTKKNTNIQNLLVVISSYIFYGWWDWRFLFLIILSTLLDYTIGLYIFKETAKRKRKLLLYISLFINLGFLGFFKYYNFFLDNFIEAFSFFNVKLSANSLNIILPVGISFYTFQTLSYTIDIYQRKITPTKNLIAFSAFVCFFPQLVAGPIERAKDLLPQFLNKRVFNYNKAIDGLRQILFGLFKKIVIADNCAVHVNEIYSNIGDYSGSTLILVSIFFSFQLYADFSGYSDIAIGTSRLFGFNLKQNFAFPFFASSLQELWRRWHISLTTWFRDYVYIPLGGNRVTSILKFRNILVVFIITGFWHGANWTYIVWGALNGLFILFFIYLEKYSPQINNNTINTITNTIKRIITFSLFTLLLILFRSQSLKDAIIYFKNIFSNSLISIPEIRPLKLILIISIFMIFEWYGRKHLYAFEMIKKVKLLFLRWSIYLIIIVLILYFKGSPQQYIYFQF